MSDHDAKLHESIGYIRGVVESIDKKVTEQNGSIASMQKKVNKHEIILGKFGAIISGFTFALAAFFNLAIEWIKRQLM